LASLLERGNRSLAGAAAQALATIGDREAVRVLIAAARQGSAARSAALSALGQTTGPEVEALMLELAHGGALVDQRLALGYFIQHPGPAALAVAEPWARDGTREQRQQ